MLHRHFGGVLNLAEAHAEQFAQRCRRHGAGGADFSLAAAFRTGNGRVGFDKVADQPADRQRAVDVVVGKAALILHILEHRRHNGARAAGRRGDDRSPARVLFARGKSIGADQAVFPGCFAFVNVALLIQQLRLALNTQSAVQHAARGQPVQDRLLHRLPDVEQIGAKALALVLEDIVAQPHVVFGAKGGDCGKRVFAVDLRVAKLRRADDFDLTAADAQNARKTNLFAVLQRIEIHRVFVLERCVRQPGKPHLGFCRGEFIFDSNVGFVPFAGGGQRAEQIDPERVGGGIKAFKKLSGFGRSHRVG